MLNSKKGLLYFIIISMYSSGSFYLKHLIGNRPWGTAFPKADYIIQFINNINKFTYY